MCYTMRHDGIYAKSKKPLSRPHGLQTKIMKHLAENPAQTVVQIQTGIGNNYHSAISRSLKGLVAEGAVTSIRKKKLARGAPVNLWGLSLNGLTEVIFWWGNKTEDIKKHCRAYKDVYPAAEGFLSFIRALETVSPEKDIASGYIHALILLKKHQYDKKIIESMLHGYMSAELGLDKSMEFFKILDGDDYNEDFDKMFLKMFGC